ncbi:MAG: insulinase family protein, partial [Gemmatimonadota bacterium]|nr:insulinase family protein [Gemmatimonadota bacterium]
DWYDSYRTNISAVTTEDVLNAARTHLHPESLQIVIVGDADAIREPLEEMKFGPVDVISP